MWKEDSQMIRLVFRSTLQLLLIFNNEILEAKTEVDVVYMDFRKALDSVSHNGLLKKPNSIAITVVAEGVLAASFPVCENQWFYVKPLQGTLRSATGQCIRTLTFYHLRQRHPWCIKSVILFIFADDTKCLITVRSKTDTDKLQEDINSPADWSHFTNLYST